MMVRVFFNIILILSISCTKESSSEFATGTSQDGIVGKWKLVEYSLSDGTALLKKNDVSSKNYIITFDDKGNVKSPDFPCTGKFTYDMSKLGNKGENNLQVSFAECSASEMVEYSIKGNADASIVDNNTLILNSETCDEPCTRIYRRLK
ncbi:hypothetical protein ORI89_06510 [Sphingobacterium sp. UT-1RO-CII-1]|uniref:hypothetical protein n=1 Tax=Sphingobacterium sp. UT-1RO-CII-1 TaxID=2995225 RepID=UPI00227B1632|nr:hypothetical protein [Sphingobacterium sp. UT-1RO-CII-1]MCY4779294.1 hypothetical protein [Sphingobacterium sp. UT-1RO-CII-1]